MAAADVLADILRSRLGAVAVLLVACHQTPRAVGPTQPCPGPYSIVPGTCVHAAPTGCQGVCGYIVRRGGCAPVKNANISPYVANGIVPNAASDDTGHFDLVGVAPGHYTLRVTSEQDDARIELDVTGGSQ